MRRRLVNRTTLGLLALTLLALGLRLLAWGWNAARPLGGDEREYLDLAIHLAQGKGYYDLQFMRPPLFPAGLAALVWLFDGDLPLLRLANALVSAATVPLVFWWTRELGAAWGAGPGAPWAAAWRRAAWWAAGLAALSYTLALNATELLTETVFLAGLTICFALLARAGRTLAPRRILLAGAALGLLCLIRSVALPLGLLGAAWLVLLAWRGTAGRELAAARTRPRLAMLLPGLLLIGGLLLPVLPWTARNAARYGGFILIDTTGQENLWLDNDPRGREAVKAELYAMGERRIERAGLASRRGLAAIAADPGWVAAKAWREFGRFWALEQADDLSQRRAIWVPAAEVWLRLALGDGLWLLILLAGAWGLAALPNAPGTAGLRWLLALWAAYTVFTGALFHVELRYRLPLFPVLLPAAGWAVALAASRLARRWRGLGDWLAGRPAAAVARPARAAAAPNPGPPRADQPGVGQSAGEPPSDQPGAAQSSPADPSGAAARGAGETEADQPDAAAPNVGALQADLSGAAARGAGETGADRGAAPGRGRRAARLALRALPGGLALALLALTLLHRPYHAEAVRLARKHLMLWQAERSFRVAPLGFAQAEAARARQLDPGSALAPALLARVELAQGRPDRADELLRESIRLLPAHPYAHLLRGDLLRAQGRLDEARAELRFETASREDLQGWARQRFSQTPLAAALDIGGGLDLGAIAGFYPAEEDGTRWTGQRAELWLSAPAGTRLALRVAAQRPAGAPPAVLEALVNGQPAGSHPLAGDWQELELPIPASAHSPAGLRVELRVRPWTPHEFDRFNPDGRDLGVRIDWAEIR